MTAEFQVVSLGWSTTIQDRGRAGLGHLGVPPSGAVDRELATLLNRLVGNVESAAVLETAGGVELRVHGTVLVATSGEPAARSFADGSTVRLAPDSRRAWQYLAVRGGIEVATVLGSRSRDTLSGLGPELETGARLTVGAAGRSAPPPVDIAPIAELRPTIRVTPGPRADWFEPGWEHAITTTEWSVTTSSRVGVRLSGGTLPRRRHEELPSEGLVRGAIQVPPDGDPVMMLADHPTTGGYPVIAVVHPADVAAVAQRSAGRVVRFEM